MGRELSELNKMLIMTDLFDDLPDAIVQVGVAINADDFDDFIEDMEKLAVEKYGGKRFSDLLDEDPNDIANAAASRQYFAEQVERIISQATDIVNGDDE